MKVGVTIKELNEISLSKFEEFLEEYPKTMDEYIKEINRALKEAAETGRSSTGNIIFSENKEIFLRLVLAYYRYLGYNTEFSRDFNLNKNAFQHIANLSWD